MSELTRTDLGSVDVTAAALSQLVVRAVSEVDGARMRRARRGLRVTVEGGRARVSLELSARRGAVLPELAGAVQERVAAALETMCGVRVDAVDVSVEAVEA